MVLHFDGVLGYNELFRVTQIDGVTVGFEDRLWLRKDAIKYLSGLTEYCTLCIVFPSCLKPSLIPFFIQAIP
jgi:hypothetical protein